MPRWFYGEWGSVNVDDGDIYEEVEHLGYAIRLHNTDIDALTERAESAERALALSEQIRSISVRADAYEQKCRQLDAAIKRAEAAEKERDLYKPYYDAIIDMAVVNWTLDGLSQKDAHHAIQRIILQHAQEACDPQLNEELAKRDAQIAAVTAERDQLARNLIQRNLPDFYRLLKTTADAPPMEEVARQAECEDVELVAAVWQHASEYFEGKIKELSLELEKTKACFAARNEELNLIAEVLKVHRGDIVDEIHRLKIFALKCEVDAVVSDAPDPDELGRIAVREWMSAGLTNVPFDALPDAEKAAMRCMVIAVWNHGRQENQALLKDVATHADNAKTLDGSCQTMGTSVNELLEKYKRRDAQYLEAKAGEQREGTRVYELEKDIYCLRNELAAETRLSEVLDRVGVELCDRSYCADLDGSKCEHCEFLRDLRRFAEGRNDE